MTTVALPETPSRSIGPRLSEGVRRLVDLLVNAVLQVRVVARPYAGVMHLLLFWGVSVQVVGTLINLQQYPLFTPWTIASFPRGQAYLYYQLVMDLAGIAILLGVAMAAFRRGVLRPRSLESRWDDWLALILLAVIALDGFALEGARLLASAPAWSAWTPVGSAVAGLYTALGISSSQAASAHAALFWTHVVSGLALVAVVPFTKMRHLVTTPINILARPRRHAGALTPILDMENAETLGVGSVRDFASEQLLAVDACLRCGRCEDVCPATIAGADYSPRVVVAQLRDAMCTELVEVPAIGAVPAAQDLFGGVVGEAGLWTCSSCGHCITACPAFVNPVDKVFELRRYLTMTLGQVPKTAADVLRNMERQSNPWGMAPEDRSDRARSLDIPLLAPGGSTDVLLYLGCAATLDERNAKATRALVQLLREAHVDFATLGQAELCCGETARRLGHEYQFQEMARANIERLRSVSFRRIVTPCPHGYNTLKNEYPEFGGQFEVLHATALLATLKGDARPAPDGHAALGKVAYHDSCYLGRYNDIYRDPRALLDGAGVNRVELARHGADSFCCGGGGGLMWQETEPDQRINQRRLDEVVAAGVDVVATACPYCLLMFDDAIRSRGISDQVRVMDIAEVLVARPAAEGGAPPPA